MFPLFPYIHSRGRRAIETAFGILTSRWRMFQKPIRATFFNVEKYGMTCLTLHNYLRQTENAFYLPSVFSNSENDCGTVISGSWRSGIDGNRFRRALQNLRPFRGSRYCVDAISLRDYLNEYVNREDRSVPWQLDYIRRR